MDSENKEAREQRHHQSRRRREKWETIDTPTLTCMLLTLSRREIRWVLPSSMNISASFTAHAPGSVAKNQARQLLGDWIGRPSGSYIIQAQNINPSTQLEVVIT
ncbi:hypothetical protein KEM48_013298 [Puccinia striiformis f. sp. tritici PST-130]|nr:hypothetical protein KEM48_013298 [Puccinia striiformis f. sp. tritici PST-130]